MRAIPLAVLGPGLVAAFRMAAMTAAVCGTSSWIALSSAAAAESADKVELGLERTFREIVLPFVATHCGECHADGAAEGDLDLGAFATIGDVTAGHQRWNLVLERLAAEEMPPEEASSQPTREERAAVVGWIRELRSHMAAKNAGDPGVVLARRLSNAEYNYTIRDLTGVDIRPADQFPVDPANEAGFDNTGESLTMSPALVKKYMEAARRVADHLVLEPDGLAFAPHPVVASTDRDKYCVLRIVDFYQRQPTDIAEYLVAAWRYKHRAELGAPDATLESIAAEAKLSPGYLARVWEALDTAVDEGPLAKLQARWSALPGPAAGGSEDERRDALDAVRPQCVELREWIVDLRQKLMPRWDNLRLKGVAEGSQPFILWKNGQYAAHRRSYDPEVLQAEGVEPADGDADPSADDGDDGASVNGSGQSRREQRRRPRDPDLFVPAEPLRRAACEASFAKFCDVFPDAFYISERGRAHMSLEKQKQDKGRLLTAGFHNSHGYFRDDQPLYELVLDDGGRAELDRLWDELNFFAFAPERQHADFIFYERAETSTFRGPEFDFIRSEDKDAASEAMVQRLAEAYLARARAKFEENGGDAEAIPAIEAYFQMVNQRLRRFEALRLAAEPRHLEALVKLAARAYRRPLVEAEQQRLREFYALLRTDGELDHDSAVRDVLVSILMSPNFCYRVDLVGEGADVQPLSDAALASRLSYFLWSSMPDAELSAAAARGELHTPEQLAAQARRMLRDERVRGLATEFGGNWLDVRRFEEHNAVDRGRFPQFDDALRSAMFEEPMRYFVDLAQRDGSVLDFLDGKHTFVNAALARHYGMPAPAGDPAAWVRVDDADAYGRGGLLPMAVFLTKNAPGLRTSPVKRGYWVVKRVLGETIPPPPATVPELPTDEAALGERTLREALAAHRADPTCAACHARFDSFGLVFEGYGPVGERRDVDLGGRPIDASADFPGGASGSGVEYLRHYIREHRQQDFVDNLCRKLLSYGLGRSLLLSDEPLVEEMRSKLAAENHRFGVLVEAIVASPQFRTKRGRDDVEKKSASIAPAPYGPSGSLPLEGRAG
jgi:mono/diheme cytochrome c family protein